MVSKLQEASLKKQEEERGTQAQEKWLLFSIFFFRAMALGMWDFNSPTKGSKPCPLPWNHGILTAGPPGNSLSSIFIF